MQITLITTPETNLELLAGPRAIVRIGTRKVPPYTPQQALDILFHLSLQPDDNARALFSALHDSLKPVVPNAPD